MLKFAGSTQGMGLTSGLTSEILHQLNSFILVSQEIRVSFDPFKIEALALQARTQSILRHFAETPTLLKAALFEKEWNLGAYDYDRHDPVIRTALKRLRKQAGIQVITDQGAMSVIGTLIIG